MTSAGYSQAKKTVIIRNDTGDKTYVQKRLLLCNLKELYEVYKNTEGTPHIGFSSFAYLRPPYCVIAGGPGTYTMCVCIYHQNAELQVAALGQAGLTYKDLISYAVCNITDRDCMLQRCKHCDREVGVKALLECLDVVEMLSNSITYKEWQTKERCILIEKTEPTDTFISTLSVSISKLTRHHYIAMEQAKFFKYLKENLQQGELVIVGDFSENYSFTIQDEVQGFHWDNSQPFVVYYHAYEGVQHNNYCFISNETKHGAAMVYAFIRK